MRITRFWFILLVILGIFLLAACNGGANTAETTTDQGTPAVGQDPAGNSGFPGFDVNNLTAEDKFIMGTLKLETTDFKVTSEEAAQLLPLWQAYLTLSTSNTAAQVEIDALIKQIGETMTTEQNQAISGMTFAASDFQTIFQDLGITNFRQPGLQGTPSPDQTPGAQFGEGFRSGGGSGDGPQFFRGDSGGGFEGGPGGAFGGFPGGGTLTPDQQATRQARFSNAGGGTNQFLLRGLIQFLQTRSQETQ